MTSLLSNEHIFNLYQYFYSKKYGNKDYKFKPSDKAIEKSINLLCLFDEKYNLHCLGINFLINYFLFQFSRLEGQKMKRFSSDNEDGKIQIHDIIGKKSFQYWLDRNTEFDYNLLSNPIVDIYKISIQELHNLYLNEEEVSDINKAEEIEKQRFYNTNRGLENCLQKTSLFYHRSSMCLLCQFRVECKVLLKNNYPKIFKNRNYVSTHK